jgi:rubrerythrin
MPLENFGSVLNFAIELEQQDAAFYSQAAGNQDCTDCRELFEQLSTEGAKQEKTLVRARQENVTEMILQTIEGLHSADFFVDRSGPQSLNRKELLKRAADLEANAEAFYNKAGEALSSLSGVSRTFSRLAAKRRQRRERLESMS